MSKRDGKMEAPAVLIPETILQAGLDGCEVERGNTNTKKASECVDTREDFGRHEYHETKRAIINMVAF